MPKPVVKPSGRANRGQRAGKVGAGTAGKRAVLDGIVADDDTGVLDPQFRPEFVDDLVRIRKGSFKKVNSLDEILRRD